MPDLFSPHLLSSRLFSSVQELLKGGLRKRPGRDSFVRRISKGFGLLRVDAQAATRYWEMRLARASLVDEQDYCRIQAKESRGVETTSRYIVGYLARQLRRRYKAVSLHKGGFKMEEA